MGQERPRAASRPRLQGPRVTHTGEPLFDMSLGRRPGTGVQRQLERPMSVTAHAQHSDIVGMVDAGCFEAGAKGFGAEQVVAQAYRVAVADDGVARGLGRDQLR
jgi:hypothetical protein